MGVVALNDMHVVNTKTVQSPTSTVYLQKIKYK